MYAQASISALLAAAALPALAQGAGHGGGFGLPNASVLDTWTEFETACGRAISDPLDFVTTHPTVSREGQGLVVRSPDNQVVVLYNLTPEGVFRQIEMTGIPGALKIVCDVHGTWDFGDMSQAAAQVAAQERDLRQLFASRPDTVLVGGEVQTYAPFESIPGVNMPNTRIFGIQTQLGGKRRYVYANIELGHVGFIGLFDYTGDEADAQPSETTAPAESTGAADIAPPAVNAMRAVVEACLRNYRTPGSVLPALEAAGMVLSPGLDAGSWDFAGNGVNGVVIPGDELFCSIQSSEVPLDAAQSMSSDLAYALFPDMIQPGAPEGGKGPCDGLSIFAPRQLIWMRYAHAGNSGECINDGTSAIIIN